MEKLHESGPSGVVPKIMPLELLKKITNNFSEEQKLGSGTFGEVYKGVHNGEEIAVKMLHLMPEHDDLEQFKREFENLRRLRHQNIVQLLGYCYEIKLEYVELSDGRTVFGQNIHRALCFQYMHKGSLRKHLSDEFHGLDWHTRYKIIKGTCEGLKYLHEGFENPIYHMDLKPDNILLDKDMVPKLADFGLSKLVSNDHTKTTRSSVGTIGYLPPEYIERNLVSKKLDIFSLGVVMIQIISGENGYHQSAYMSSQQFINLVLENWRNRLEETSRCTSLEVECHQVKRAIEIALDCIHADRKKRPQIGDIVDWLNETEQMIKKVTLGSVYKLVSEVESMSVSVTPSSPQLTSGPMDTSTEISSIRSTEISKPLDVHPLELRFPWQANRRIRCPVSITNRTDHYIGVCIKPCCPDDTTPDLHSLAFWDDMRLKDPCSPLFRLVEPHSTLVMTMMVEEKHLPPPPQEIGIYEVMLLEMRSNEVLENVKSSNGSNFNIASEFVKGVRSGNELHVTFLSASICDPSSCQEAVIHQLIPAETLKDRNRTYIDVHPTETWILVSDTKGWVSIWNYETKERIMVLKVTEEHINDACWVIHSAKFIAREQWFVTGDDKGWVQVYSYATKDKMTEFEAHHGTFLCTMAVHPTEPFLLTSTPNVTSIKLWDWSKEWMCIRTFEVPNKQVFGLLWNPRDTNTFTSVSLDHKVKVWDIDSSYPTTLPVESGSAAYLSFGSNGNLIATACYRKAFVEGFDSALIWDLHEEKRVHKLGVWGDPYFVACHPTIPIMVTMLGFKIICIWDTRTYRLEKMIQLQESPLTPEGFVFTNTKDVIRLILIFMSGISIMDIALPTV